MKTKQWLPRAMREAPSRHDQPVIIGDIGSDQNGNYLYSVSDIDGGPAALTAPQWANLGLTLNSRSGFDALEDYEAAPEADDDLDEDVDVGSSRARGR